MQDRHTKRLDALDRLGHLLLEFHHAVTHIAEGDIGYSAELDEYSAKARSLGRETESLLGPEAYKAIITWTDAGRAILDASFVVTERAVAFAQFRELSPDLLAHLQRMVGTKHPVREGGRSIFLEFDEDLRSTLRHPLLSRCDLTDEYSESAYDNAFSRFNKFRDEITRTLPSLPA
jgi:hypothetical protein